jgi:hypothetical protein
MNRPVWAAFAAAVACVGSLSAAEPAKPVDPRVAVYGQLLTQPAYKAALDVEVQAVDNNKAGSVLTNLLVKAREADDFRGNWVEDYRAERGNFPAQNPRTGKPAQLKLFSRLTDALEDGTKAAAELGKEKAEKWDAWLVITRGLVKLSESVPDYPQLLGIEPAEAKELQMLRLKVHQSLADRRKEWGRYLEQAEKQLDAKTPTHLARLTLDEALADLTKREAELAASWDKHIAGGEFPKRWAKYFSETAGGSPPALKLSVEHTRTWTRPAEKSDPAVPPPTYPFDRAEQLSWPFALAHSLDLGTVKVGYDSLGFDGADDLSKNKPVIVPRIRLRGVFEPKGMTDPKDAITAVDVRLSGQPVVVGSLGFLPDSARVLTPPRPLPNRVAALAVEKMGGGSVVPGVKEEEKRLVNLTVEKFEPGLTPITPPATPEEAKQVDEAVNAVNAYGGAATANEWLTELPTALQDNAAVVEGIGRRYWGSAGARRLKGQWTQVVAFPGGSVLSAVASAATARPDDLAPLVGDHVAVRDLILRAGQTDAKAELERAMAGVTADKFDATRRPYLTAKELIRTRGGDLTAACTAEELLYDAAQARFDAWTRYLASMLPAPVRPIHHHPWPALFPPEVTPDPIPLRGATERVQRELDRLLFTQLAPVGGTGANPELNRVLGELAGAFSPTGNRYLETEFKAADLWRMQYAEVNRLLLLTMPEAVDPPEDIWVWAGRLKADADSTTPPNGIQLLAACLSAGTQTPSGTRLWMRDKTYRTLWRSAQRDVPHARYLLGREYETGDFLVRDPYAAAAEYITAARQGHPLAARSVGRLADAFTDGRAVPKDLKQAAALRAALNPTTPIQR